MNEEEIKTKIILPFLSRLGLQTEDLHLEESFSLHIGTKKIIVNGRKTGCSTLGARLDILVKRKDSNLLVLEVKKSSHKLTDDDRDQAISYARLVHPIAPFAVLTNGTDWRIFDAVSKENVKAEDFKIKDVYRITLPDSVRNEALNFFLGYSVENLLQFCHIQVEEQMKPLKGSPSELTKKYIPDLTTPRSQLLSALNNFEESPANGFLLLAESGMGKTSSLCDFVCRRLAEGKPTLFFSGGTLENGLQNAIKDEFSWTFSEEQTPVMLVRQLSELAKDAPVVIVVDAIDEWPYLQRAQSLLNLLRNARGFKLKFVFSCRTNAWENISQPFGSDIGFSSYLFAQSSTNEPKDAYLLSPLTTSEFDQALQKYREMFKVKGLFEDRALSEAKVNPFMLRVMFAVAAEQGEGKITLSSSAFFEKYLDLLLRKTGHRELAQIQVCGVARLMFEKNKDCVAESEVRSALSLSGSESLLPELFEQNILQAKGNGYTFYFQHLRSYLIAFKVFDWPTAKGTDLLAVKLVGVQLDALAFYLRYAKDEQIKVLTAPIWENANHYLNLYSSLVARHFPNLDHEFVPGEHNDLGFIAEYVVNSRKMGLYGFRRRHPDDAPVLLVPVDKFFGESNLLDLHGADELFHAGSANNFLNIDVRREVVKNELIRRVEKVIAKRRLTLGGFRKIADEALLWAICNNRGNFASLYDSRRGTVRFPFTSEDVRRSIIRTKLYFHFEHEMIEMKRRQGNLQEYRSGNMVSYNLEYSEEERQAIWSSVDQAIATGDFPALRTVSTNTRDLEAALTRMGAFEQLSSIVQPPWITERSLLDEVEKNYDQGLITLKEHIRILYEEFLLTYQQVVDTNFPTLKNAFSLRAQMPVRAFLVPEPHIDDRAYHRLTGHLTTVYERLPVGTENEVIVCHAQDLKIEKNEVSYQGRHIADSYSVSFRLDEKIYSLGDLLLSDMVYNQIAKEWPVAAEALMREELEKINGDNFTDLPKSS